MEIGHVIANLRKSKDLSQLALAKAINVSRTVVGLWETDNRTPSYENICSIADYFCISTDILFDHDRKLSPLEYKNNTVPEDAQKILNTFLELNEENRDILIGEARKLLKEQRIESESSLIKKAT